MIHHGDCLEVMAQLEPASVDAIVTDPPYGLTGHRWGSMPDRRSRHGTAPTGGFMGKAWDGTGVAFRPETWFAALRVAKPGAYLLAFGGTRTFHRLACAIEDAGWIIRDTLIWCYASGFPKGKANLKPAFEPIVMARKPGPLRPLAIDECRIGPVEPVWSHHGKSGFAEGYESGDAEKIERGRWPANVILTDPIFDGGWDGVVGGGSSDPPGGPGRQESYPGGAVVDFTGQHGQGPLYFDGGTYSRFFLIPKADRGDREPNDYGKHVGGLEERSRSRANDTFADVRDPRMDRPTDRKPRANHHPTVKPIELMRHLVRLVTPQGGTVLDPFLGSGTTGIAAEMEGFAWIGIEKEAEYVAIAEARLAGVQRGLGLDVPAPVEPKAKAKGHWPKQRGKGGDGYGFTGQTDLEERYDGEPRAT